MRLDSRQLAIKERRPMLFTCPSATRPAAGAPRRQRGGRRTFCVDIHCHVHLPPPTRWSSTLLTPDREPSARFSNELSPGHQPQADGERPRRASRRSSSGCATWTRWAWTSRPSRRSPFHFMYWLEPELARKVSRAVNEHLAAIVEGAPRPLRRPRPRAAAGAGRRGRGARVLRDAARLPRRRDRHQRGRGGGLARARRVLGEGPGARRRRLHAPERLHRRATA